MKTFALLLLATLLAAPVAAQVGSSDYTPMKVIQTDRVIFPRRALDVGITSGDAVVAVQIDADGKLTDSLVVQYSHPAFGERAADVVKRWRYEPAVLKGERRGAIAELAFEFRNEGIVLVELSGGIYIEQRRYQLGPGSFRYSACSMRDLDRIPTPRKIVKPDYPLGLAGGKARTVSIDFYIDEAGRVRLPAVSVATSRENDTLATLALNAVTQWEFEPPVSKGRPVLVLARQDFNFEAKPEIEAAKLEVEE